MGLTKVSYTIIISCFSIDFLLNLFYFVVHCLHVRMYALFYCFVILYTSLLFYLFFLLFITVYACVFICISKLFLYEFAFLDTTNSILFSQSVI